MPATTFSTIQRRPIFASNYLAHGGPTREGAHAAHLKDVDVGQRFSLIHVLKGG